LLPALASCAAVKQLSHGGSVDADELHVELFIREWSFERKSPCVDEDDVVNLRWGCHWVWEARGYAVAGAVSMLHKKGSTVERTGL
jgi:hypothetical protein